MFKRPTTWEAVLTMGFLALVTGIVSLATDKLVIDHRAGVGLVVGGGAMMFVAIFALARLREEHPAGSASADRASQANSGDTTAIGSSIAQSANNLINVLAGKTDQAVTPKPRDRWFVANTDSTKGAMCDEIWWVIEGWTCYRYRNLPDLVIRPMCPAHSLKLLVYSQSQQFVQVTGGDVLGTHDSHLLECPEPNARHPFMLDTTLRSAFASAMSVVEREANKHEWRNPPDGNSPEDAGAFFA